MDHHRHHAPRHPVVPGGLDSFIDASQIAEVLEPWIPEPRQRDFVVRCLLEEGPVRHRGANFVLLKLLGEVLKHLGGMKEGPLPEGEPVPLRLPPHRGPLEDDKRFPLSLQTDALKSLTAPTERSLEAMVDCLTDGPPQHALANVAMVNLLTAILSRLKAGV